MPGPSPHKMAATPEETAGGGGAGRGAIAGSPEETERERRGAGRRRRHGGADVEQRQRRDGGGGLGDGERCGGRGVPQEEVQAGVAQGGWGSPRRPEASSAQTPADVP